MPLTVKLTPGKVVTETDLWTVALLNLIANPTIELEGTIGSASLSAGAIDNLTFIVDGLFSNPAGRAKFDPEFVNNLLLSGSAGGPAALSNDATGWGIMADKYVQWRHLSDAAKSTGRAPAGGYRSLVVQPASGVLSVQKVDVTAVDLVLTDINGVPITWSGTRSADMGVVGAGGLEASSTEQPKTWYYIWIIADALTNPTGPVIFSAMLTASPLFGSITMPTNYSYAALVGVVRNGAPKSVGAAQSNFMPFHQIGRRVWLADWPIFANDPRTGTTSYAILGSGAGSDSEYFQATVPPIAVMAIGAMGTNQAVAHSMVVAAAAADGTLDSAPMGASYYSGGGSQLLTNENFGTFRVPIRTSYPTLPNIQWKADVVGASPSFRLIVNGFEL